MDVDLLSSSDESSFDDVDIMNDVTQPHACEAKDDKEVTQECIQDVWAACSWQQKKMSCREVVLTENSTFVSNLTEAVPLDASQARMTKEAEMKVCIDPKEEICNIINAILRTPNCNCSLCYRHLRQANCPQLKKHWKCHLLFQ